MDSYYIEIVNPKVLKLLKELEKLDLIRLSERSNVNLESVLQQLRSDKALSPETFAAEVEVIREVRYGKDRKD